jgi:hypothetical protein
MYRKHPQLLVGISQIFSAAISVPQKSHLSLVGTDQNVFLVCVEIQETSIKSILKYNCSNYTEPFSFLGQLSCLSGITPNQHYILYIHTYYTFSDIVVKCMGCLDLPCRIDSPSLVVNQIKLGGVSEVFKKRPFQASQ